MLAVDLRVLFVGINPSNCSGAAGYHFATPGNRFWSALDGSGFTDRLLRPDEREDLLARGIGVSNLVNRATPDARMLEDSELREGAERLRTTLRTYEPRTVAILGKRAYRVGFGRVEAEFGRQPAPLEGVPLWLLPNPSPRSGHYQLPRLIEHFAALRASVELR